MRSTSTDEDILNMIFQFAGTYSSYCADHEKDWHGVTFYPILL